jgi:syntaxin of plants SYP7
MVATREDEELTDLLTKLYTIQEDIGAKPKTTDEEKRAKAENAAKMGTTKKAEKKGSKFLELKSAIVDRLKSIHQLLKDTKELENAGYGGDNAKEVIKKQAEVREQNRQATDEWRELEAIYKNEARKKKSKFTPEELEVQSELVKRLYVEIEKVKALQMKGYARGHGTPDAAAALNTKALAYDPSAGSSGTKPSWAGGGGGVALTGDQQQQIMALEERDAEFDLQLDEIGEGILDLQEIAQQQGEEVALQGQMLDKVDKKLDKNLEKMTNVNTRMKDTLEEVGRASDKLMVDIMCIVLAIGFGAVIYNFATVSLDGRVDNQVCLCWYCFSHVACRAISCDLCFCFVKNGG